MPFLISGNEKYRNLYIIQYTQKFCNDNLNVVFKHLQMAG